MFTLSRPRFTCLLAIPIAAVALLSCNRESALPAASTQPAQQAASPMSRAGGRMMYGGGGGMMYGGAGGMYGPHSGMMQQLRATCPVVVPGAKVSVSDIKGGVALTFTTDKGDIGDLRTSVQYMAQMYGMHRGRQAVMWRYMGGSGMGTGMEYGRGAMGAGHMNGGGIGYGAGMASGMAYGPMPAATIKVTNVPRGARIELRPTAPSELAALRAHIRSHQQHMQAGQCWAPQQPERTTQKG